MPSEGKGQPKVVKDRSIEAPETHYSLKADELVTALQKAGITDRSTFLKIFNAMRPHEDLSVVAKPPKLKEITKHREEHQTTPPFDEKITKGLFYVPAEKRYRYIKIRLAPSAIKAAGLGAYAMEEIPKGAKGVYKGVPRREKDAHMYYSWTVKSYDSDSGETDDDDRPVFWVDAFDLSVSNWTRYVNCGSTSKENNMDSDQHFDKFFYVATRRIKAGEELFIDYGEEYRRENLGMSGRY